MRIGESDSLTLQQANIVRTEIGRLLLESVNSPNRYPFGTVMFEETKFMANTIADLLRSKNHPDDQRIGSVLGLETSIRDKILSSGHDLKRRKLLAMSPEEQADLFGLSTDEVQSYVVCYLV